MAKPRPQDITPTLPMSIGLGRRRKALGDYPLPSEYFESWHRHWDVRGVRHDDPMREIATWLDTKPPFAKWFNHVEQITVGASASRSEITAYIIPQAHFGVFRFFANAVGNASDAAFITFAIEIDGAPMQGWASMIGLVAPSLQVPTPMMDPLLGGQRLRVVASNSIASSITNVGALIRGWTWASQLWPSTRRMDTR